MAKAKTTRAATPKRTTKKSKEVVEFSGNSTVEGIENNSPAFWRLFGSRQSSAGVSVDKQSVFGVAPFLNAVRLISSTVGRCDCHVYDLDQADNSRTLAKDHQAFRLLYRSPNPSMPPFLFFRQLVANAIWAGNGYAFINESSPGVIEGLYLVAPDAVTPVVVYTDGIASPSLTYSVSVNGHSEIVRADQMIHLRGMFGNDDGLVGLRLIDVAREALGLGIAQQKFAAVYFSSAGNFQTVVKVPKPFKTLEEQEDYRRQFDQTHAGLSNAHRVAIIGAGTEIERHALDAEDTQFASMGASLITTVANIVGLPPHKLGGVQATSYGSILAENTAMYGDCYDSILTNLEQELETKLLTEAEKASGDVVIEFNRASLLKGDAQSDEARVIALHAAGLISFEEARRELNRPTKRNPSDTYMTGSAAEKNGKPNQSDVAGNGSVSSDDGETS